MKEQTARFKDRRVTVVGLARSGLAAANLLHGLGAKVTVSDIKTPEELSQYLGAIHPQVKLELSGHNEASFLEAQTIVISPGVPWDQPLLAEARSSGVEIISELELASELTEAPVVAVTGTNGKSTTTVLVGEMLKATGKKVSVGGNLGHPMVEMVQARETDYLVVEVSSFQLEGIVSFRPHMALMLNISPDHLDRHTNLEKYLEAKKRIYLNMGAGDFLIVNGDQQQLAGFGAGCMAHKITFSRGQGVEQGVFIKGGWIFSRLGDKDRKIIKADKIRIKGTHNLENALAAVAAAETCGVEPAAIREVLKSFEGLPHRLEKVLTLDGVLYVNDSKGTNVGAVVKSLESFQDTVILIAGGKDKGGDYAPLRRASEGKVKKAILIGEAGDRIAASLEGVVETISATDMREAVRAAHCISARGDVVLLSPACSSFDMFKDFEERGEVFKNAVHELQGGKVQI